MPKLISLNAREVLDSRGRPTVEVDAVAATGAGAGRSCPQAPAPAGTRRSSCATRVKTLRRAGRAHARWRT